MYKIGEFSRLCQATIKTLRYYDEIGLLQADVVDRFTGYRYYSSGKVKDYYNILLLKELGFSLEEIKVNITNINSDFISQKMQETENEKRKINDRLEILEKMRTRLAEGGNAMGLSVIEKKSINYIIAGVRRIVKDRSELNKYFEEAKQILEKNNIKYKQKAIINEDIEYLDENLDLIIGYELEETDSSFMAKLPWDEDIIADYGIEHEPRVDLTIVCENNIKSIDDAYSAIIEYAGNNEYQIVEQFTERYYDDNVQIGVVVRKLDPENTEEDFKEYLNFQKDIFDYSFVNNEKMIGTWRLLDILPKSQMFSVDKRKSNIDCDVNELVLLPNGKINDKLSWTGESILHHLDLGVLHNHAFTLPLYDDKIMEVNFWDEISVRNGNFPMSYFYEKID